MNFQSLSRISLFSSTLPIPMSVAVKDLSAASSSSSPAIPVKVIPLRHPDSTSSDPHCHDSIPLNHFFSTWTTKIKRMTFYDWIDTIFPCFLWIRTYRWQQYFKLGLMAGVTVGIMLVPQAMSYARLAGLQPIYGLCALIPMLGNKLYAQS